MAVFGEPIAISERQSMQVYVRPSRHPRPQRLLQTDNGRFSKGGSNTMFGWRADGKELWYTTADGRLMGVDVTMNQTFSAGEPRLLFQQPPGTIAAATNGDRFLLAVPAKESTRVPFTVIPNWRALLKKQENQLH